MQLYLFSPSLELLMPVDRNHSMTILEVLGYWRKKPVDDYYWPSIAHDTMCRSLLEMLAHHLFTLFGDVHVLVTVLIWNIATELGSSVDATNSVSSQTSTTALVVIINWSTFGWILWMIRSANILRSTVFRLPSRWCSYSLLSAFTINIDCLSVIVCCLIVSNDAFAIFLLDYILSTFDQWKRRDSGGREEWKVKGR